MLDQELQLRLGGGVVAKVVVVVEQRIEARLGGATADPFRQAIDLRHVVVEAELLLDEAAHDGEDLRTHSAWGRSFGQKERADLFHLGVGVVDGGPTNGTKPVRRSDGGEGRRRRFATGWAAQLKSLEQRVGGVRTSHARQHRSQLGRKLVIGAAQGRQNRRHAAGHGHRESIQRHRVGRRPSEKIDQGAGRALLSRFDKLAMAALRTASSRSRAARVQTAMTSLSGKSRSAETATKRVAGSP